MNKIINPILFFSLIFSILPALADTEEDSRAWGMLVGKGQLIPGKLRADAI